MCILNIFTKKKEKKQQAAAAYAQNRQIQKQLQEQKRQELLMRQQEDVMARNNNNEAASQTLKENEANNFKRRINSLRIPLLKLQGTGANIGEDVGYGLNLGGTA